MLRCSSTKPNLSHRLRKIKVRIVCHPERSEGSSRNARQILRFAQNDGPRGKLRYVLPTPTSRFHSVSVVLAFPIMNSQARYASLVVVFGSVLATTLFAQTPKVDFPQPSPTATLKQHVGLTD